LAAAVDHPPRAPAERRVIERLLELQPPGNVRRQPGRKRTRGGAVRGRNGQGRKSSSSSMPALEPIDRSPPET
jgi:hypothetical protein